MPSRSYHVADDVCSDAALVLLYFWRCCCCLRVAAVGAGGVIVVVVEANFWGGAMLSVFFLRKICLVGSLCVRVLFIACCSFGLHVRTRSNKTDTRTSDATGTRRTNETDPT